MSLDSLLIYSNYPVNMPNMPIMNINQFNNTNSSNFFSMRTPSFGYDNYNHNNLMFNNINNNHRSSNNLVNTIGSKLYFFYFKINCFNFKFFIRKKIV